MAKKTISLPLVDFHLDCNRRVKAAALCDFLQTAATVHADSLGVGMLDLQKRGVTWMLAKMDIVFVAEPTPRDVLTLETWPAGTRAGIVCVRNYRIRGSRGDVLVEATSDWVCVDMTTRKLARLTPDILAITDDNPEQFSFKAMPKLAKDAFATAGECNIPVRRADLDLNRHVNNVHYIEWLLEPMSDEAYARRISRLAISYHAEAVSGEVVRSEVGEVRLPDGQYLTSHTLHRGDTLLTKAMCMWEERAESRE